MPDVPPLIRTQTELAELCDELSGSDFVAVDTEFIRERTYYPKLCLVQIATSKRLALIDALADIDLTPFLDALHRTGLVKVLHAARQDLEIFFLLAGSVPAPVFDSQIAAACLGYGEQLSYANLAEKLLGVEPGKSHARTDWTRRPLAPEQLRYAADDVRFLVSVYHRLREQLSEKNREHWLDDAFGALTESEVYAPQPDLSYKRVRGAQRLNAAAQARLVGLAAWREHLAMRMDRPRRWIVGDETLLALAVRDDTHIDQLREIPGLPTRLLNDQGDVILDLLKRGENVADDIAKKAPPTAAENKLIKRLSAAVREEAERLGTSPALLATRAELVTLAGNESDNQPLLSGWRREVIGQKLLAIKLAGAARTG